MTLTWDHALYVVVLAVTAAVLDYRRRRGQERNDRITRAVYETVNGGGLMGAMRKVQDNQVAHEKLDIERHEQNVSRLDRIEEALMGRHQ